ncbi:MAG: hypothetical protein ABSA75_15130 [Candidatus Bathyarchaeia archaeon]|jgi:hypothetical protein
MVGKYSVTTEEDLLDDLTFHGSPASLLKDFALKIIKPYLQGHMNEAIKNKVVSSSLFFCVADV